MWNTAGRPPEQQPGPGQTARQRTGSYCPVPDSGTACLADCALSVTFNAAEYETLTTGLNVTLIVQLLPAVSELRQVGLGVSMNCGAFVPVTDMLIFDSVAADHGF
ncbi:MAG TPA: hypothetical protein VMR62_26375 [Bryobacteraceae bacterium]|nr:hypothetical protein [Bryobacteraceae bacterium]